MRAKRDRTWLGNVLVELGHTNEKTVNAALSSPDPLGETLVSGGAITAEQLHEALVYQKVYRGELSPGEAARLHQEKRRQLMSEVLEGLRCMVKLTTDIAHRFE